jgi:hypothetical protein
MGSSEFEFGTLPGALKRIRAHKGRKKWKVMPIVFVVDEQRHTAYYVGDNDYIQAVRQLLVDQVSDTRALRFKEATYLRLAYLAEWREGQPGETNVGGWWALSTDIPFAFFKEKEDAELWLRLVGGPRL